METNNDPRLRCRRCLEKRSSVTAEDPICSRCLVLQLGGEKEARKGFLWSGAHPAPLSGSGEGNPPTD